MTLEEISYASQIVGAIAVVASLIFVGIQLRHSAEQSKQANILARADMTERQLRAQESVVSELIRDADLAATFRKVMFERTELAPVETTRILTYFNVCISTHISLFHAYRNGLLDESIMKMWDANNTWYLTAPAFAREWRRLHHTGIADPDFYGHLNRQFAERYPGHPSPMLSEKEAARAKAGAQPH